MGCSFNWNHYPRRWQPSFAEEEAEPEKSFLTAQSILTPKLLVTAASSAALAMSMPGGFWGCATSLMKTQHLHSSTDLFLVRKLAIDLTFLNSISLSFPSVFFLFWKEVSRVYFSFWLVDFWPIKAANPIRQVFCCFSSWQSIWLARSSR